MLILTIVLLGMSYFCHFIGKEAESELTNLPQIHKIIACQTHDFNSMNLLNHYTLLPTGPNNTHMCCLTSAGAMV